MTVQTWPVNGQPMSDVQWSKLTDWFVFSGVLGGVNGVALEAYATPGQGLYVKTGSAIVRGVYYTSDAVQQVTVPTNGGGSPRLDLLTLRSDLTVDPNPVLTYVVGGTTAPTVRREVGGVFDVPLAVCSVPAGSVVPSTVTDARLYAGSYVIPTRSVNDVPFAELRPGVIAAGAWGAALWQGSQWVSLYDEVAGTITLGTNFGTFGGQYKAPSWRRIGRRVYLSGVVKRTAATIQLEPSDPDFRFTGELPSSYRPNGVRMMVAAAGSDLAGMARGRVIYKPGLGLHYQPGQTMTLVQNTGYIALDGLTYDLD